MSEALSTVSITKTFPGVKALDDVSVSLESGKIYSLVGENGAGKTTLIRIIAGIYETDNGKIFVQEKEADPNNALEALEKYKIACVHQESTLIPNISIAENFFLENENDFYSKGFISRGRINSKVLKILRDFGIDIDVEMKAKKLRPGEKRIVELAKALYHDPDILILDEITAPLAEDEVEEVFDRIKEQKEKGKTVIFISHRMGEVMEISDEAIVLKDGKMMGTLDRENLTRERLVEMMVGQKSASAPFPEKEKEIGESIFEVRNLSGGGVNVDFEVKDGEILALSGLKGHGMSRVLQMIYGVKPRKSGNFYFKGKELNIKGPKEAVEQGLIYISDDKDTEELWPNLSVKENIVVTSFKEYSNKLGILNESALDKIARENIERFSIDTPSMSAQISKLSGGNRQKVVFAKWLTKDPHVVLANRPAIGLDVGAKEEVYHILRNLAKRGVAVLTFLSELPEVVNLPDRVLVMRNGKIVEELEGGDITEENVIQAYYKEETQEKNRTISGEINE